MVLAAVSQRSPQEIAQEICRTLRPPVAGGRPFLGSSPRTTAVEAWLDLRRQADPSARAKLDQAIQQALVDVLADGSAHPEAVCGHLRLLRLAWQEGPEFGRLSDHATSAILTAAQSARFKHVKTTYGDAHAELLACVEALNLAPSFTFWRNEMTDLSYVTNAVSGCLGSGSEHCALSGMLHAVKLRDPSLALALMRLFRIFYGRENLVWARFAAARRHGLWSKDDYDLIGRAMAQLGQSCPDDPVLQMEEDIATLQRQVREERDRRRAAEEREKRMALRYASDSDQRDAYFSEIEGVVANYARFRWKPAPQTKEQIDTDRINEAAI